MRSGLCQAAAIMMAIPYVLLAPSAAQAEVVCDGNNDQLKIQAAIDALPQTGGKVTIASGTCELVTEIRLDKSFLTLEGQGGSTVLEAIGGAAIKQPNGTSLSHVTLRDFRISASNSAIQVIFLRTIRYSLLENIHFDGQSSAPPWSSVFLKLQPDYVANPLHEGNVVYNEFRNLSATNVKVGLALIGYFDPGIRHSKITNNRFFNITLVDIEWGIRLVQFVDTNHFSNINIQLNKDVTQPFGVAVNHAACPPPASIGACAFEVYANDFENLAVEIFFDPIVDPDPGAVGLRLGFSRNTQVLGLTVNNQVANPILDVDGQSQSHYIVRRGDWQTPGNENSLVIIKKGVVE